MEVSVADQWLDLSLTRDLTELEGTLDAHLAPRCGTISCRWGISFVPYPVPGTVSQRVFLGQLRNFLCCEIENFVEIFVRRRIIYIAKKNP